MSVHEQVPYYAEKLIAGDESAFRHVYDLYGARIYRLAYKFLKDKASSEEIVQETFIRLWLTREKIDVNGNLWLYLYVIAQRLSLNSLRAASRSQQRVISMLADQTGMRNNPTEENVLARDLADFTEELIRKLPRQQQQVFRLSRLEGLSHKEIAALLHLSPHTVKNHLAEAIKSLRTGIKHTDLLYFTLLIYWF